jgi:amino acid transporter
VSAAPTPAAPSTGLARRIGLFQATAINMSQMCGVGPFITIPLMVAAFGGPQAIIGWIAGAALALVDGLIWAELGASLPGSGGTYVYLREAFQYRSGKLMPFLFVWTAMLFIPLIMSTGVVGLVSYLGYLWPGMTSLEGDLVGVGVVFLVVLLLWRRIESIGRITVAMWAVMITAVLALIIASYTHFHASQAFSWPAHAIQLTHGSFWIAFASGLTIGIYDYLGYNTASYTGAEIKDPGRVMPRAIVFSIMAIMGIYLLMQIGVLGVVDWHQMLDTHSAAYTSVASLVLEKAWGHTAAQIVTGLILVTAFASVFAGLLGGSRVPYDAARDRVFFKQFGTLHPRHRFPVLGLVSMGVITALGFLFGRHTNLQTLISLLTTVMVIVQSLAQVLAVTVLRKRQPQLKRPYRMWLYPLPGILAGVGWLVVYGFADKATPGVHPIEWSLAWLAIGLLAFALWSRFEKVWPFGPKEIREQYLEEQQREEAAVGG